MKFGVCSGLNASHRSLNRTCRRRAQTASGTAPGRSIGNSAWKGLMLWSLRQRYTRAQILLVSANESAAHVQRDFGPHYLLLARDSTAPTGCIPPGTTPLLRLLDRLDLFADRHAVSPCTAVILRVVARYQGCRGPLGYVSSSRFPAPRPFDITRTAHSCGLSLGGTWTRPWTPTVRA